MTFESIVRTVAAVNWVSIWLNIGVVVGFFALIWAIAEPFYSYYKKLQFYILHDGIYRTPQEELDAMDAYQRKYATTETRLDYPQRKFNWSSFWLVPVLGLGWPLGLIVLCFMSAEKGIKWLESKPFDWMEKKLFAQEKARIISSPNENIRKLAKQVQARSKKKEK